jgi:hypothetical protein
MIVQRHLFSSLLGALVCPGLLAIQPIALAAPANETVILSPQDASYMERLAAREVRRYVYLRTGRLLPIASEAVAARSPSAILVARKDRALVRKAANGSVEDLAAQSYCLKTVTWPEASIPGRSTTGHGAGQVLLVTGGGDVGTLYAAYSFAEALGVRFYLHGDVIPDDQTAWALPALDQRATPLFPLRGIQPFHDFPEGPDWWNRDDYLAIIAQLPKLRMNFIGLHTYPEGHPNAEPTAWIGLPQDVGPDGRVQFSYASSYMNTLRGNWGYAPKRTSDYLFGSAQLFERDDYGPEVMFGAMPSPAAPDACNVVFDRSTAILRDAFIFAHQLGVKTCVGTETPLIVPKVLQERLKAMDKTSTDLAVIRELYEGIFRRAAQAYPLDYYWLWTPEGWTWSGVKEQQIQATTNDLAAAIAAHRKVQPPFALATCGWVLGPPQDRAMFDKVLPKDVAVSCINRQVGYTPVDAGFAEVKGRSKWAIPWLEDDGALAAPELWAGRMRRDAFDALRYGCDGLMGIHWRTRVLSPNVAALAQAAWDQSAWAPAYRSAAPAAEPARVPGPVGGQIAAFPNNPIAGTSDGPLYQTVRYNLSAYHLPATNGMCKLMLKFCEPHYGAAGLRVFDVKLQGRTVLKDLDIFARVGKNRALDCAFTNIVVDSGWLDIDFVPRVEFPSIAAIVVEGQGFCTKINCGGPAYADYAADPPAAAAPNEVFPPTRDFYEDWAVHEFGPEVGVAAAGIFQKVDCALPKPSTWVKGPGGIRPDSRPWEQARKEYAFVDDFAALSPKVKGAGSQERFHYWLNTFLYLRAMAELNCAWGEYNRAIEKAKQEKTPETQCAAARQLALPARQRLVGVLRAVYEHLLATVSTTGELGTVANWNQHNVPDLLTSPGEELAKLLGEPLPADTQPIQRYDGPTRIIVPTARTSLAPNEALALKVIVLSEKAPRKAALYWRKLGARRFAELPLLHLARGVFSINLPPQATDDFEYYLKVEPENGHPVLFPATAPALNQTVVVCP